MPERRGPKGQWKLIAELRGKILLIVLREGIWKLEAIQQRLLEAWHETVSLPSIQQVLEENGLGDPTTRASATLWSKASFLPSSRRRRSWFCLWTVLPRNPGSKPAQAVRGRCKAQRQTAALREARLEPQSWGEDGGATPIRPRSESIWIGWNKVLTMRMLAGCCLRRCWRDMIFCRP